MVWLRCSVSAMGTDNTQGCRSRRTDLVMGTRPMVVPGGQVRAVAVGATVSWKAWALGREDPHV